MATNSAKSLADIHLFSDLDAQEVARLEARCKWRRYPAGREIIAAGSESKDVFLVTEGAVNILSYAASGKKIAFATLEASECFGELAALDGRPRSASAVAATDCLIAVLSSSHFLDLLQRRVEVTFKVLTRLSQLVRAGDVRIMELSTLAAANRVYAELLRMAKPDAAVPGLFVIRNLPPLHEIASRISTTRETVARTVSQLYESGLARRKGRNFYIMDRAKLLAMKGDVEALPGKP